MFRRHHRFFQSLQVLRDASLVALAFVLAYLARFSFPDLLPFGSVSRVADAIWVGLMLVVIWPAVGWVSGLYVSRRSRGATAELFDALKVSGITFLVLVTLTYFVREVRFSRGILLLWLVFAVGLIAAARMLSRSVLRVARMAGYNLRHVVIVGAGDFARHVLANVRGELALGLRVVGLVAPQGETFRTGERVDGTPVLGTVEDLATIIRERQIDQVIVALPIEKLGALKGIMATMSQETVDVRVIPDFYQYITLCGSVEEFAGLPIINLQATPLVGWNLVIKRLFDIVVATAALVLVLPAMAIVASLVRLSSSGPIFFRQERVGMDGRHFSMYKFRTMYSNAESLGARMAVPGDPRCTPVGTLLRRVSLDELPQLLNVLKGDMSLVGPRPERPCFAEDFRREIPRYALRHKIKAGMTGWAQVNGMRGQTSIHERIELDLYYIENWSLLLDIKILLRTLFGGFLSPNAY